MLKSLLPSTIKVNITIDDIRLNSNSTTDETIKFTEKSFTYTILAFTQSYSRRLGDIKNFFQLIPGPYKSDKTINITGIEKISLKCDCNNGTLVNGIRELILYSFALSSHPGQIFYKNRERIFLRR